MDEITTDVFEGDFPPVSYGKTPEDLTVGLKMDNGRPGFGSRDAGCNIVWH